MQKSLLFVMLCSGLALAGCQSKRIKNEIVVNSPEIAPEVQLGNSQILTILPQRVACSTPTPMQCYIAKVQDVTVAPFQIPYLWIDNFTALPNTLYQIEVKPYVTKEDGKMTGKWALQRIVSQN